METKIAQKLSNELRGILGKLDGMVLFVMENCSEEDFESFRSGIGSAAGALVVDVMMPLYEQNPEVKPIEYKNESEDTQAQP